MRLAQHKLVEKAGAEAQGRCQFALLRAAKTPNRNLQFVACVLTANMTLQPSLRRKKTVGKGVDSVVRKLQTPSCGQQMTARVGVASYSAAQAGKASCAWPTASDAAMTIAGAGAAQMARQRPAVFYWLITHAALPPAAVAAACESNLPCAMPINFRRDNQLPHAAVAGPVAALLLASNKTNCALVPDLTRSGDVVRSQASFDVQNIHTAMSRALVHCSDAQAALIAWQIMSAPTGGLVLARLMGSKVGTRIDAAVAVGVQH